MTDISIADVMTSLTFILLAVHMIHASEVLRRVRNDLVSRERAVIEAIEDLPTIHNCTATATFPTPDEGRTIHIFVCKEN